MLKKDLLNLYEDAKSIHFSFIGLVKRNILISTLILIVYLSIFFVDPIVRDWFSKIHNNFFDFVFNIGHWYGKPYLTFTSFLLLYIGGILFSNNRIRESGWKIFEAFVLSGIIVTVIKSILGRWRPYTEHGNFAFYFLTFGPNDHLSLPSGDVAIAFAFSTVVAGFFDNKAWKIFWFSMAVLTALGRIYHDQHWLTDVILAAVISTCVGNVVNNNSRVNSELT